MDDTVVVRNPVEYGLPGSFDGSPGMYPAVADVTADFTLVNPTNIRAANPLSNKEVKPMIGYIIISVISGILFGLLDGVVNANPSAQRFYEVYRPIAKTKINPLAGIVIDLAYGFVMAGVFLLLYNSLPGETGLIKGVSFAVLV